MKALLWLCAVAAAAQSLDRSKPPETAAARPFRLPSVFESTLPNGLTVLLVEDTRAPLVTVRLAFACGSRRDPKELPGVAAAVVDMLTQATLNRTRSQLLEQTDAMGASIRAVSGPDQVAVAGSVVADSADDLEGLLELVSDVARNATFPELELTLYRQSRRPAAARERSQPGYVANEALLRTVFGESPYARLGQAGASDQLGREALVRYRDRFLIPNNAVLIIVGKLPAQAQTMKAVMNQFSSWEKKTMEETPVADPPAPGRRLLLIDRPGAPQAEISMGRIAARQRDADYAALLVANAIASRRLPAEARCDVAGFADAGWLTCRTQAKNEKAAEALRAMTEPLEGIAKEAVTSQELADAKTAVNGSLFLRIESQAGLAEHLAMGKVLRLPADYTSAYSVSVNAVSAEQVQNAAKKYLAAGNAIVVVGDAAKIGKQLQGIGTFEASESK